MEAGPLSQTHATSCILARQTQVSFLTAEAASLIKQLFSFMSCRELSLCGRDLGIISLSHWCEHAAAALMPAEPDKWERASLGCSAIYSLRCHVSLRVAWSDQISSSGRKAA